MGTPTEKRMATAQLLPRCAAQDRPEGGPPQASEIPRLAKPVGSYRFGQRQPLGNALGGEARHGNPGANAEIADNRPSSSVHRGHASA